VLKSVTRQRLLKTEKTLCVLQLQWYLECVVQWDCYNNCGKTGYQETSGEDRGRLCELWLQWNLKCVGQWECCNCLWRPSVGGQWIRYPIWNPVERHSNTWQYLKHLCLWETFKQILCDICETLYNKNLVRVIFSKLITRTMIWAKQKCTFGKPVYLSGIHI
jgi:hypothetical protein